MFDGNHTNPINGSESAKPKDNESTALKKENPALESHTISHIELANIIHGPPGTKRVIHTRQNETTNDQTPKNDSGLAFDNPRDRPSRNPLGPNVQMSGSAGRHKGGRIEKTVIQDFASTMKNGHMDRHSPHLWQKFVEDTKRGSVVQNGDRRIPKAKALRWRSMIFLLPPQIWKGKRP